MRTCAISLALTLASASLAHEANAGVPPVYVYVSLSNSFVKVTTPNLTDTANAWQGWIAVGVLVARGFELGFGVWSATGMVATRSAGRNEHATLGVIDPTVRMRLYPSRRSPVFIEAELGGRYVSLSQPSENVSGALVGVMLGVDAAWAWRRKL